MKVPVAVFVPALVAFPILADDLDPASIRLDHFTGPGVHQVDGIGPDMAGLYRSYVKSRFASVSLFGRLPGEDNFAVRLSRVASARAERLRWPMRFDLDGDGRATEGEVEEALAAETSSGTMSAANAREYARRARAAFAQIDGDGDGLVTLDEAYDAALSDTPVPEPVGRENPELHDFLRMDLDGDGQVNSKEVDRVIRAHYGD